MQPDEQGVVLRFGAFNRMTLPGLNDHLPWPIERVETPAVTRINRIEVGYRSAWLAEDCPGHMASELFQLMTGLEFADVPYRGGAPALTDLLAGQVHVIFEQNPPTSLKYIRAGKLRPRRNPQ